MFTNGSSDNTFRISYERCIKDLVPSSRCQALLNICVVLHSMSPTLLNSSCYLSFDNLVYVVNIILIKYGRNIWIQTKPSRVKVCCANHLHHAPINLFSKLWCNLLDSNQILRGHNTKVYHIT